MSHPHHTCRVLLLVLCGDIQSNPGPEHQNTFAAVQFGMVKKATSVTSVTFGITDDVCKCAHQITLHYIIPTLSGYATTVDCKIFPVDFFAPSFTEHENSSSILADSIINVSASELDFDETEGVGSPVHTSSPKKINDNAPGKDHHS